MTDEILERPVPHERQEFDPNRIRFLLSQQASLLSRVCLLQGEMRGVTGVACHKGYGTVETGLFLVAEGLRWLQADFAPGSEG